MTNGGRWAIAAFYAVWGTAYALIGLAVFFGWAGDLVESVRVELGEDFDSVTKAAGIILALLGAFLSFTGWGIYRWRRWARWVVVAISTFNLAVLSYIAFRGGSPPMNYILAGTMSLGFLYWAFQPDVVRSFASGGVAR